MTKMVVAKAMTHASFSEILARWPDRQAVYEDASAADPNLKPIAVYRWERRGMIPPRHWSALVDGAGKRQIPLKLEELANARKHADQVGHAVDKLQVAHSGSGAQQ